MYLILAVLIGLGVWVISYGPLDPHATAGDSVTHGHEFASLVLPENDISDMRDDDQHPLA